MAKDHPTGKSGLYAAFLELETPEECYRFLQDVCSYAELSAMEQRYNIAEKLMRKQSYTSIMGNIGASSAIISRVSRVLSRDDSVLREVMALEPKYREVLLLHYYQNMNAAECAHALHMTTSGFYRRLKKAQARLKPELERWGFDER